jgi:hypothetical protein
VPTLVSGGHFSGTVSVLALGIVVKHEHHGARAGVGAGSLQHFAIEG